MSDEEIIKAYDSEAEHTIVGTSFYLDEIIRRQADKATKRMERVAWISLSVATLSLIASVISICK